MPGSEVTYLQKRRRKQGRYAGYVRITALACVVVLTIFIFDSLRRHSKPSDGDGGLTVTVDSSNDVLVPESEDVPAQTMPSAEEIPYERKEINEADYRPVTRKKADLTAGELILVNRTNSYRFPDVSALMVKMASNMDNKTFKISYNTHQLQKNAMDAFNNMMNDFYSLFSSGDVTVVTSTVSYSEQNEQYKPPAAGTEILENENQLSPGFSEHHTGYAFDLKLVSSTGKISAYDGTGNYKWINDNCYKYGFTVRYPVNRESVTGMKASPSHFRYVGVPHSYIMKENGFTLEEYINDLKKYVSGYEHLYYSVFGYDYEIYYVPASPDGDTTVPVPKNDDYTVSGNNADGFIVTICRASDEIKAQAGQAAVTDTAVTAEGEAEAPQETAAEQAVSAAAEVPSETTDVR